MSNPHRLSYFCRNANIEIPVNQDDTILEKQISPDLSCDKKDFDNTDYYEYNLSI